MQSLNEFILKIINYRFTNPDLLTEAVTHPSVNKRNNNNQIISYERLEFLGDSILNMVISAMLFRLFPDEQEGALAKRKTDLVCGSTIANIAKEIKLSDFIIMSNSEICNGGKNNSKNLENVLEALIGALYIDGGFKIVEEFIFKYWEKLADTIVDPPQDCKTELQEWTQKNGLPLPEYKVIKKTGPAHKPEFTISIVVENYGTFTASAYSKKLAERKTAELVLQKIKNYTTS